MEAGKWTIIQNRGLKMEWGIIGPGIRSLKKKMLPCSARERKHCLINWVEKTGLLCVEKKQDLYFMPHANKNTQT